MPFKYFYGDNVDTQQPDKILRERYFPDYSYRGTYLDVGAGHPFVISNSFHFRMNGWKVYAIDASSEVADIYRRLGYPFVHCGIADKKRVERFFQFNNGNPAEGGGVFAHSTSPSHGDEMWLEMRTLNDVLQNELSFINVIDIFDLDIEFGERDALLGLDLDRYRPKVILVEDHLPDISGVKEILTDSRYVLDFRDGYNYYYLREEGM